MLMAEVGSVRLLAQEGRDLDLVHAVGRQRLHLRGGGAAMAPDARHVHAAEVLLINRSEGEDEAPTDPSSIN